jgi:hypothetical protein
MQTRPSSCIRNLQGYVGHKAFRGSFGLLTGSCAAVRSLLFRRGSREWGFPDYNGSI